MILANARPKKSNMINVTELRQSLSSKYYHLKEDWLNSCIDFLSSVNVKNDKKMEELVIEQFLNSNICDSYESVMKIPKSAVKFFITKKMIFQIQSYVNVAIPLYEQYIEAVKTHDDLSWFHGNKNDEYHEENITEQKVKKENKNFVKLTLTDGVNTINAFDETNQLFADKKFSIGSKIILIDRAKYRRGVLFLNPSNYQILGGSCINSFNIVTHISDKLQIDVDLERKKKEMAKKMANEFKLKRKNKNALSQSTLSPFLVKKGDDEVENNESIIKDSFDQSVPNVFNKLKSKITEQNMPEKIPDISKKPILKPRTSFYKSILDENKKGLSARLDPVEPPLAQKDSFHNDTAAPTIVNDSQAVEIYDPSNISNQVKNVKVQSQPNLQIIPEPFDLEKSIGLNSSREKNEIERRKLFESFTKQIHGPRGVPSQPPIKRNADDTNDHVITDFFNTVRKLKQNSDHGFNKKLVKMGIVTPVPKREHVDDGVPDTNNNEKTCAGNSPETSSSGGCDSLNLESTIEMEGRLMCERLGLPQADSTNDILPHWNSNINTYRITNLNPCGDNQTRVMNIGDRCDEQTTREQESFKKPRVDFEHMEDNDKKNFIKTPMDKIVKKPSTYIEIFNTPMARRIPSSESSSKYTDEIRHRLSILNIIDFKEALFNRKFWMMPKIVVIMATRCILLHDLKSDGIYWQLMIQISDTSIKNVNCTISSSLLDRIFGFTVSECKELFDKKKMLLLKEKKIEAEKKLLGFNRLDLIIWVEVSPLIEKWPMVVDVKTISDALNIL